MKALPVRTVIQNAGDIRSWQESRRVWCAIERLPGATHGELAAASGVPKNSIKLHIERLAKLGILEKGPKRSGRTTVLRKPYAFESYLDEEEDHAD